MFPFFLKTELHASLALKKFAAVERSLQRRDLEIVDAKLVSLLSKRLNFSIDLTGAKGFAGKTDASHERQGGQSRNQPTKTIRRAFGCLTHRVNAITGFPPEEGDGAERVSRLTVSFYPAEPLPHQFACHVALVPRRHLPATADNRLLGALAGQKHDVAGGSQRHSS